MGVIWNHKGEIFLIYHGNIGHNSNNAAELEGLIGDIEIVVENKFFPLIVEGDSQIILLMVSKIMHRSQTYKLTPSWRLDNFLSHLTSLLLHNQAMSFHHVK